MTDLLPCPFCGGEAERHTMGPDEFGNEGGDVVECSACGASSHVEFGRKENLVSTWNRRSDTSARRAAFEEAAKVADHRSAIAAAAIRALAEKE